jgi:hypothetical protein
VHKYTPREIEFLEKKGAGRSQAELADLFNQRFGLSLTVSQINGACTYYGMSFCRRHKYTPREICFLENKVKGRGYAELTALFNKRFGLSMTTNQIGSTLKRYNLTNGRDCRFQSGLIPHNKGQKGYYPAGSEKGWFKTGNMPQTWRPMGTEIVDENGYTKIKTRNPKTWKRKHRLIWEKANGKIPRGHVVIFGDGNKLNFVLDNLLLISRSELAVMNREGLISNHRDLTKVGKSIADIKILIAERKRRAKKTKRRGRQQCPEKLNLRESMS